MMSANETSVVPGEIEDAVRKAGEAILALYAPDIPVERKADRSPVTEADRRSHAILAASLVRYAAYPILSEEGRAVEYDERKLWEYFWLVDPLDGTKEFLSGNGEFTVNVALMHGGRPVMGAVFAPVKNALYIARAGKGAYRIQGGVTTKLPLPQPKRTGVTIVGSRSHGSPEFEDYVRGLRRKHDAVAIVAAGSSLKLCLVAEGTADLYPRLGTTMEWDTAAGQMIVEEAGGTVVEAGTGRPLRYNKSDLRNPHFIAARSGYHA